MREDELKDGDPTSASEPQYDPRRVPAYRAGDPAEQPAPIDATRTMKSAPPDTSRRDPSIVDPHKAPDPNRTSTDLARSSQKQRRRERDQRAEKTAMRVAVGAFVCIGAAAFWYVNTLEEQQPSPPPKTDPSQAEVQNPPPVVPEIRRSAAPDETPDIPALVSLQGQGLTIAAEGLPLVRAVDPPNPPALFAGIETCRFAYAVWEFSPNKAFRFITTCAALQGQILVGAYEVSGSQIRTSAMIAEGVELISVFEVEKPSKVRTQVTIPRRDGTLVKLEVEQRLTTLRAGMEGEGFYRTYAPKNTLQIQGMQAAPPEGPAPKAPPSSQKEKDPVLELLDGR